MSFAVSILEQGLIYGILALGIYITYKILDFPDLTVDGSFPLGAAVTALMITKGANPYLTLPAAFAAGVVAGICTGLIHVKCKVRDLLSGIIMMTALWTINLRVAGTANVPLFSQKTIFKNDTLDKLLPSGFSAYSTLLIILIIALIVKIILDLYLNTKSGYLLRAVGDNDKLVTAMAKDEGNVKILGLAIANGLCSLAGCIFCQEERVFEITSGDGNRSCKCYHRNQYFQKNQFCKNNDSCIDRFYHLQGLCGNRTEELRTAGYEADHSRTIPGNSGA